MTMLELDGLIFSISLLAGMGHGSFRDLLLSRIPDVMSRSLSSSGRSGSFSRSRRSVLILFTSCLSGMYSDRSFLALSCAILFDSSACLRMVSMALMSAWICLSSSTCAIFSCWRSSISLLYSARHLSSSSIAVTSHSNDTLVFSSVMVLFRISLSASSLAKAVLSSRAVIVSVD